VDNTKQPPTAISFCPGIRGIERGVERVIGPVRTLCFVEIEAIIIQNLVDEMEACCLDAAPIWSDCKTFPAHLFRGRIDWIFGGYPCTPFSLAGLRKGEDDPRHLWPFIRSHVKAIEPMGCFFENVDDHLTLGFDTVYKDLRALGYTVEAGVFTAEEVGAPHERQRLFILAIQTDYLANSTEFGRRTSAEGGLDLERKLLGEARWHEGADAVESRQAYTELAYTESCPAFGGLRYLHETNEGLERSEKQHQEQPGESGNAGEDEVADSDFCRQQQWVSPRVGRQWQQEPLGSPSGSGLSGRQSLRGNNEQELQTVERTDYQWPSGPGQPQHEWEHPRTVERKAKPPLGLSVNGFSFREDFLRALGNACVPATAERAFKTLIKKFL
jgi:DNA (cytosine-5)-methyltransferase 1